ncbi:mediator of RNA polymerase II transcription subunit 8 [Impatiens glandulifera]|uniref:mediator of RNA polymerase II transcription subunit 8 n=1 Tax=Impatiens glandulifera TaxID=253017 RepID=UPI001FB07F19|nr:mediator of RNA polymerase II transcription subunit 8 [Impatiens glandulifera]
MDGSTAVPDQFHPQQSKPVERLNQALQQQLNLDSVKTRAISLLKAISRILEEIDIFNRTNSCPKWQDILGQFSMVNLELFSIVEDIKKVSKAFIVNPKNVNAENAPILPVMLSTKLLPEMEMDDNAKRDQLLNGLQNLPITSQIDKLKMRIDMIAAACESAEKVIADTRKAYFGTRQGPIIVATLDKVQAAKIQEQENLLRGAVNHGEGLRLPGDQRQITTSLPLHLVDVIAMNDGPQAIPDASGMFVKATPPLTSSNINNQGNLLQASGGQLTGRAVASPGAATTSFDNTAGSPLQYANSPRSGTSMMNAPSPQQQAQQQQLLQQQQRQKMMQHPSQQQLLAQQQFRHSSLPAMGQNQMGQLPDLQGQAQQKFQSLHGQHQMQFSPPLVPQQFQGRQMPSGSIQHGISQAQLNQGNQLNRLNQFSTANNNTLFNTAQGTQNNQMAMSNMSATMASQPMLPRVQFGLSGANRSHTSQILNEQMFNMGATNSGGMMPIQQQQQQQQGTFGNMSQNTQLNNNNNNNSQQQGMVSQNHTNFQQQRQQNPQ